MIVLRRYASEQAMRSSDYAAGMTLADHLTLVSQVRTALEADGFTVEIEQVG